MSVKLAQISVFVYRDSNRLSVVPSRKLDSIHKFNAVDTVSTLLEEGLLTKHCRCKVFDYTNVKRIFSLGIDLYLLEFRLIKSDSSSFAPLNAIRLVLIAEVCGNLVLNLNVVPLTVLPDAFYLLRFVLKHYPAE